MGYLSEKRLQYSQACPPCTLLIPCTVDPTGYFRLIWFPKLFCSCGTDESKDLCGLGLIKQLPGETDQAELMQTKSDESKLHSKHVTLHFDLNKSAAKF